MTAYPEETLCGDRNEIAARGSHRELTFSDTSVFATYDRDWNRINNLIWRFGPAAAKALVCRLLRSRRGELNLTANSLTSESIEGSSSSKVVAQEDVTTLAGTFNVFKIERQVRQFNTADPSKLTESQIVLWYAPQINHFVRRTTVVKFRERTRSIMSEELADFTRGP
jgi:hypothetical protein